MGAPVEFPRSFLFSNHDGPGERVTGGWLARCPLVETHTARHMWSRSFVTILGYAIDLDRPDWREHDIAGHWLAIGRKSIDDMLAATDTILGRFTAICRIDGQWIVFNDAGATRTTYFTPGARFWLASHSSLIAEQTGAEDIRAFAHAGRYGLVGNHAPFAGVRVLPPNFWLDPISGRLTRFWPRRDRKEVSVADAYPAFERLLLHSAEQISERWPPAVSLTAGLDSRVSFAAFRRIPNALFFTYRSAPIHITDVNVAREICRRYDRPHRYIPAPPGATKSPVSRLLAKLVDERHAKSVAAGYFRCFADGPRIHVRSNLAEIGQTFWWKKRILCAGRPFTAETAVRLCAVRNPSPAAVSAFAEYLDLLAYDTSDPYNPVLNGYDAWDLYYLEHRMATWHGPLLLGSDVAFDTAILFNSRALIETMLSVDLATRREGVLFKRFITDHAPALTDIPFNPEPDHFDSPPGQTAASSSGVAAASQSASAPSAPFGMSR
jgi:hypothetical protein